MRFMGWNCAFHGMKLCVSRASCLYSHLARCGTFLTNETGFTKVVEFERRILETINFRRKSAAFGWLPLIGGGLDARS